MRELLLDSLNDPHSRAFRPPAHLLAHTSYRTSAPPILCTVSVRTTLVHHFGATVFLGALHRSSL